MRVCGVYLREVPPPFAGLFRYQAIKNVYYFNPLLCVIVMIPFLYKTNAPAAVTAMQSKTATPSFPANGINALIIKTNAIGRIMLRLLFFAIYSPQSSFTKLRRRPPNRVGSIYWVTVCTTGRVRTGRSGTSSSTPGINPHYSIGYTIPHCRLSSSIH